QGEITPLTIAPFLKEDAGFQDVGGIAYLAGLAQAAPAMPPVRQYATILKDLAARRAISALGQDLMERAGRSPFDQPTDALAEGPAAELARIVDDSGSEARAKPVGAADALEALLKRIESQATAPKPYGVKTGLEPIDEVLGALYPGKFIVAAARPGMGKSIL